MRVLAGRLFLGCGLSLWPLACPATATGESAQPGVAQIVEIPSGDLVLKASLWKPAGSGPFPAVLFNHGSGGEDAMHTAGLEITEAAARLAPLFVNRGYAFLYLYRRGQGLSSNQAPFIQDRLRREELVHGKEARQHLQFQLMTTEQLDDVNAAPAFMKSVAGIDGERLAVVGHSFGGQLTLLAAAHERQVRAVVTFAAAANSWQTSPELRERLLTAVRNTSAPIMLIHAANDYDTSPGTALAAELHRLHRPHVLKVYPAVGHSADDGHNMVYFATPLWESDVLRFLDERLNVSARR